jgi:hypothetical protein
MIGKLLYLLNLELQKQGTFEEHLCTLSTNSHMAGTVLEWNVILHWFQWIADKLRRKRISLSKLISLDLASNMEIQYV